MSTAHEDYFEHRIGLVMYGGVSLAIYMNGVAQEFLNLVLSTAMTTDGTLLLNSPPDEGRDQKATYLEGTRAVYRQMARAIQKDGLFPKFVVDILSGTSAGGLNGMFLAKALAEKKSFDPLRDLWINEGEIELLLDRKESYADLPPIPRRPSRSLLNSRRMYLKLLNALEEMDRRPLGLSKPDSNLVEELDLHMTATDLVGRPIPINLGIEEFIPRISDSNGDEPEERRFQLEKENRAAFHFRFAPGETDPHDPDQQPRNDFKPTVNPFLAFVGRCTSSIVPAFEPMRLKDATDVLDEIGHPLRDGDWKQYYTPFWRGARFLSPPQDDRKKNVTREAEESFQMRPFGDGGYLDNKPFGHAFTSLKHRKALRPVRRTVFYLEPHPERNADVSKSMEVPQYPMSAIRHAQLATSLNKVQNINERVQEMRKLADQSERVRRATELQSPTSPEPIDLYYESTLDQLAAILSDLLGFSDDSLISALRSLIAVSLMIAFRGDDEGPDDKGPIDDFANRLPEFHKWAHENFDLAYSNRIFEFIRRGLESGVLQAADPSKEGSQLRIKSLTYTDGKSEIEKLYDVFWNPHPRATFLVSDGQTPPAQRPEAAFARMSAALDELRLREDPRQRMASEGRKSQGGLEEEIKKYESLFQALPEAERDVLACLLALRISVGEVCYVQVRTTDSGTRRDSKEPSIQLPEAIFRACEILHSGIQRGAETESPAVQKAIQDDNEFRKGRPVAIRKLMNGLKQIMGLGARRAEYEQWMDGLENPNITMQEFRRHDAAMFPLLYQAGMADSYALDLVRVSPVDARSLTAKDSNPVAKLSGIGLGHFAAFLSRPGRIMDIVWGRLDAAEVILKTYLPKQEVAKLLPKAQLAILAEALENIQPEKETTKDKKRLPEDQVNNAIERLEALVRLVASEAGYE